MAGYLFGDDISAKTGASSGQYFIVGRVKSVVYGKFIPGTRALDPEYKSSADIGKIRYELLYSSLPVSISNNTSKPAYPINSFIKQFPLISEIVLIVTGPSSGMNDNSESQKLYYFPPYSLWNSVQHNAFPNMYEYRDFVNATKSKPTYAGNNATGSILGLPVGTTFHEKESIKNLRLFEGDVLLESRFGQSVRFGSTVPSQKSENPWSNSGNPGDPITIIRNGQGTTNSDVFESIVENINKDKSSIYLTSGQEIILEDINNFPLGSFGAKINPQVERYNAIPVKPISNEIISAATQDNKSISK
jgi:hypothetical protein